MAADFEFGGDGINTNANLDASQVSKSLRDVKKDIDDTAKSAKEFISVTGKVSDKLKELTGSNQETSNTTKDTKKSIDEQTEALNKNTDAINKNIDAQNRLQNTQLREVSGFKNFNWNEHDFSKAINWQLNNQKEIDKRLTQTLGSIKRYTEETIKKNNQNTNMTYKKDYSGMQGRFFDAIALSNKYNDLFMRKDRNYMRPDLPPIAYALDFISRGNFNPADVEMSKIQNYLVHAVDNADAINPFSKEIKLLKDKLDINGNKIGVESAGWRRVGIKNTLDSVAPKVLDLVTNILDGKPINIPEYDKEFTFGDYTPNGIPLTLNKAQKGILTEIKNHELLSWQVKEIEKEQELARKAKEQYDRFLPWEQFLGNKYGSVRNQLIDFASKNLAIDSKTLDKKGDTLGSNILDDLGWVKGERTPANIKKFLKNNPLAVDEVLLPLLLDNKEYENVLKIRSKLTGVNQKDYNPKIGEHISYSGRIFDDVNVDRANLRALDNIKKSVKEATTKPVEETSKVLDEVAIENTNKAQEMQERVDTVVTQEKESMAKPMEETSKALNETSPKIQEEANNINTQTENVKGGILSAFTNISNFFETFSANMGTTMASFQRTFHGYGMFIRNLSSTIYAVSKMGAGLNQAMQSVDFMTAQAYRMQRYDTTGMSQTELINRLYNTAQEGRSSLEATSTLTQRLLATGVTKGNPNEALRLASIINKAAFIGGSTPQEAKQATMQLSQGLASNQLGGDELRSIRENAIGLTEMLSKGLMRAYSQGLLSDNDFAQVDIGKLKELGKKAKLTTQNVITAFSVMENDVDEAFKNIPQTFGQTLDKLKNTFIKRMYEFSKEGKGFGRIAETIKRLEEFINSEDGALIIDTALKVLDTAIKNLVSIAEKLATIIRGLSGVMPTIIEGLGIFMQAKFFSSLAFGGRKYNWAKGIFEDTAGIFGAGGFLETFKRIIDAINKGQSGSMIWSKLFTSYATDSNGNEQPVIGGFLGSLLSSLGGNAGGGLITKLGSALTSGGLLSKAGIVGVVTNPIVLAIAGLGTAIGIRNSMDKKADEEDLNRFLDNLPNPAHWSKLQEEDRTALRSKAVDWYNKYTSGKFIGTSRDWTDKDYEKFIRDYVDFGDNAYGKYIKSISDGVGEIASNTAGTLDITDEFIRNMNDIMTRSFRGELLMNGNGVNNTWNVVVHNEGDVKNIAEQIQQAVISAQEGMLNTPVMM